MSVRAYELRTMVGKEEQRKKCVSERGRTRIWAVFMEQPVDEVWQKMEPRIWDPSLFIVHLMALGLSSVILSAVLYKNALNDFNDKRSLIPDFEVLDLLLNL